MKALRSWPDSKDETHRGRIEQARIHRPEIGGDPKRNIRLLQNVALQVDAVGDLDHLRPLIGEAQNAALGDIEYVRANASAAAAAEGDMLGLRHELPELAFALDGQPAIGN